MRRLLLKLHVTSLDCRSKNHNKARSCCHGPHEYLPHTHWTLRFESQKDGGKAILPFHVFTEAGDDKIPNTDVLQILSSHMFHMPMIYIICVIRFLSYCCEFYLTNWLSIFELEIIPARKLSGCDYPHISLMASFLISYI